MSTINIKEQSFAGESSEQMSDFEDPDTAQFQAEQEMSIESDDIEEQDDEELFEEEDF